MASRKLTMGASAGATPVACALTPADLAAQARRWVRLGARAMTERAETEHGLRLAFRPGPGVEGELRKLVAVENECCPWATWTVAASPARIVLEVRSAGAGIATLHSMFTGLRPAPAARHDCACGP
jgi:hypothetical protein